MTREQLDAIRARVDAATPGPWEAVTPKRYAAVRSNAEGCYVYTQGKIPADTHPDTVARQQRDAQFIAAAREDVSALLAEVERLRRELDKATDDHIESQHNGAREAIARKAAEAEVERLTAERDSAFKRGVAAMREAAVGHAYFFAHPSALCGPTARTIADEIRALPDPKDRTSTEGKP